MVFVRFNADAGVAVVQCNAADSGINVIELPAGADTAFVGGDVAAVNGDNSPGQSAAADRRAVISACRGDRAAVDRYFGDSAASKASAADARAAKAALSGNGTAVDGNVGAACVRSADTRAVIAAGRVDFTAVDSDSAGG